MHLAPVYFPLLSLREKVSLFNMSKRSSFHSVYPRRSCSRPLPEGDQGIQSSASGEYDSHYLTALKANNLPRRRMLTLVSLNHIPFLLRQKLLPFPPTSLPNWLHTMLLSLLQLPRPSPSPPQLRKQSAEPMHTSASSSRTSPSLKRITTKKGVVVSAGCEKLRLGK